MKLHPESGVCSPRGRLHAFASCLHWQRYQRYLEASKSATGAAASHDKIEQRPAAIDLQHRVYTHALISYITAVEDMPVFSTELVMHDDISALWC